MCVHVGFVMQAFISGESSEHLESLQLKRASSRFIGGQDVGILTAIFILQLHSPAIVILYGMLHRLFIYNLGKKVMMKSLVFIFQCSIMIFFFKVVISMDLCPQFSYLQCYLYGSVSIFPQLFIWDKYFKQQLYCLQTQIQRRASRG